ncbi:hypothetical protein NS2R_08860 [Pseudomonas oryzihabitans]|nr:hypothetical protein NS2R_08860 [Pseudomonas psychrotolerans]
MKGGLQILRTGVSILRIKGLYTALFRQSQGTLHGCGEIGDSEGIGHIGSSLEQRQACNKILHLDEGSGGIKATGVFRAKSNRLQFAYCMVNDRERSGVVICQISRSQERNLGTVTQSDIGYFCVVGTDYNSFE